MLDILTELLIFLDIPFYVAAVKVQLDILPPATGNARATSG
jgi:hypothetical protein